MLLLHFLVDFFMMVAMSLFKFLEVLANLLDMLGIMCTMLEVKTLLLRYSVNFRMHLVICWDVLMGFALSVLMFLTMRTKVVLSSALKAKVVLSSLKVRYQGLRFEAKFANLLAVLGCPLFVGKLVLLLEWLAALRCL